MSGWQTAAMRRVLALAACSLAAVSAAACAPTGDSGPPDMVGTWIGDYSYPLADGSVTESREVIVITRQEGRLLWGYEDWDEDGVQDSELTGQIAVQGTTFVLTEEEGFFSGVVDGDRMFVRYIRTGPEHTTFEVELTRQPTP